MKRRALQPQPGLHPPDRGASPARADRGNQARLDALRAGQGRGAGQGNQARLDALSGPQAVFDGATAGPGAAVPYAGPLGDAFGVDFSGVRAWFGQPLGPLGADAATDGDRVVFADAAPSREIVAHELAHVAQGRQQSGGSAAVSRPGDASEREATAAASHAAAGQPVSVSAAPSAGLHLHPEDGDMSALEAGSCEIEGEGVSAEPASSGQAQADPPPGDAVLQSTDPEVDQRTVSAVGADLGERAERYRSGVLRFRELSAATQRQEQDWYDELGLIGGFIDLFNDYDETDPTRWDVVLVQWDEAEGAFDQALAIRVTPDTINQFGQAGERAMGLFQEAYALDQQHREEFQLYLEGFQGSAQSVLTVTTVVRDVSFAAAVGIAVVLAAPVVFGAAATFGTGTLGLSGGAATLFAGGTTAVAMGGLGATIEGGGQALGALVVEGGGLVQDLMDENLTWEQAIDGFDWGLVADQGWDGFKRGFVDGVLAYAGMGFERVLHSGARVALDRVLGEAGGAMLAQILRRGLERAIASGAAGGVIGALDAGIKAAIAGGSVGQVLQAVQDGFVLGAALGVGLGAAGGALEGRSAARLTEQVDELQRLLREEPQAFAQRFNEMVEGMTPDQRAAFQQELQGRRFVDAEHYGPAQDDYASGASTTPPEHRYGQQEFEDWSEAATLLDDHAQSGQPLTQADLEAAHASAGREITEEAGQLRTVGTDDTPLLGGGGVGLRGAWSALSPEQIAVLESNPYIRLQMRGMVDAALTPEQVAARFETALITYPNADDVARHLDDFLSWYNANAGAGDPVAFAAEAQRQLVSIHPFADGNGRMSRLVMDHALQSEGLPPALLRDPNLDYLVTSEAWADEVRAGVLETFQTAQRHVGAFNQAIRDGDGPGMAAAWGLLIGIAGTPGRTADLLYEGGVCE